MDGMGMGFGFDDFWSLKDAAATTRIAADGAGYAGYRVGKMRQKHVDVQKCEVVLGVQEAVKTKGKRKIDATYTARFVEITVKLGSVAEALAAYGSLFVGNFVVFDDNLNLVAAMAWYNPDDNANEDSENE
jgi:hypothetical protein